MGKKVSCKIIEDLMPSYIDEICSEESKIFVDEHVEGCSHCKEKLSRMKAKGPEINLLAENSAVLENISKIKAKEKKQKFTIRTLSAVSICLVVCLGISLFSGGTIGNNNSGQVAVENGKGAGNGSGISNSNSGAVPSGITDGLVALGLPSEKQMGDYTAASNYGEIYDYVRKMTEGNRENGWFGGIFDMGGMKEEAATESIADSSTATNGSMAAGAPQADGDYGFTSDAEGIFSETNVMTEGVDESDISKTDGSYIYNVTGSEIVIFDIREGEAKEVSRLQPEFSAPSDIIREMYVDGDLMTLVTEHEIFLDKGTKSQTNVMVYDIKDRENPEYQGVYRQDGTYYTSRKVGDIVYLFTNKWLEDPGKDKKAATTEDGVTGWLPTINDVCISADCIYLPETGNNSIIISSFNQKDPAKTIDTKMLVNNYAQIYVGGESIYFYNQIYSGNRDIMKISKMKYNDGLITAGASTSVRGHLNDSFAINEYNGYLRLVTSEWDNSLTNTLYVFDDRMQEKGRINNIATGEQLYACRFMGDIGYFVTYEQTDPLFTVDLTNPSKPEIVGELELLGFSEYLHFWGEDKLLGIGHDADKNGQIQGIKLSMFDIANPGNVTEEARLVLKEEDYAPGFYNYKAILASYRANLFGFTAVDYGDKGNMRSTYYLYSYEDGKFVEKMAEDLSVVDVKNAGVEAVRGHFSGNYFYLSNSDKVHSIAL